MVLFALLLPVFFACAGLAVDLGNMYSYKSNLQNAVDAAALAGASGYTTGGDTVDYHPEADEMAAEYLKANLDNSYSSLKDKSFEAQTVSGKTYYRVKVTEPSPTYFMRMLGIKPYIDVSADAVALVGNPGTTDLHFKDLIGAREILGLDSLKNGRVNTTYDGNVVDLSSRFAGTTIYTSSALGQKENQANADGNYSAVQAGEASDYNSFYRSTTEKINEMYDAAGSSVVDWNYTNRAVSGSSDYYKKETSGNANLSIGELSGNEGKPVYLMIDGTKNENKINITINSTNARPLVIIYTGTTKNNNKNNYKPLTLNIFGSGGTAITFTGADFDEYVEMRKHLLEKNDSIAISDIDDIKETDRVTYQFLKAHDVHSIAEVPIFRDNHLYGFLGVINYDRENGVDVRYMLEKVAGYLDLKARNQELMDTLKYMSGNNLLTGLHNRNAMSKKVEELKLHRTPVGIIYADLNNLKATNDTYGHDAGDLRLKEIADIMKEIFDLDDIYRLGGDEFIIIMDNVKKLDKMDKLRKFKKVIRNRSVDVAIGFEWVENASEFDFGMKSADKKMYRNKKKYYKTHKLTERGDERAAAR